VGLLHAAVGGDPPCPPRSLVRLGLVQRFDPFHIWLLLGSAAVVAAAVAAAISGVDMAVCLVILMLAPAVTVIGYEQRGYRHQAQSLRAELD
jgi:hypothetical protein